MSVCSILLGQIPEDLEQFEHYHYFAKEVAPQMLDKVN